jgi:hypothetical protein
VSVELSVAVISATVALICAAITVYGQVRVVKYQGEVASAAEKQRFLLHFYQDIGVYCTEQNAALREAYLSLFERDGGVSTDATAVGMMAAEIDKELMSPLRRYEALLDETTRAKIYEIHNVVAQLRGDPTPTTIENFKNFRDGFYRLIEEARALLKPSDVLSRTGVDNQQERGSS